jgi:hypothetical protein
MAASVHTDGDDAKHECKFLKLSANTIVLITTKRLDFVHRPDFYNQKKRFGHWICFRNVVFSVCRNPDDGQSPEA